MIPAWVGDIPTWVTTIAVVFAAGQYLGERRRRRDEAERESRRQASGLAAWAVTDCGDDACHGVRLSNTSGSTFHEVCIDAVIHGHPWPPARLNVLPPGDYFLRADRTSAKDSWRWAIAVAEHGGHLRPLMHTERYQVMRMRFCDNQGRAWVTDDSAALTVVPHGGRRTGSAAAARPTAP